AIVGSHGQARDKQQSVPLSASVRELRGDLDWISMRALEKDRTRRYGSASDLAADLRRHLDNLPVHAGPPTSSYRIRKFVRRHRMGVAAAATLTALLIAFAAVMGVQARRISRERDRANREAATAQQVSDFLIGLFRVSDPSEARGNSVTARELLERGSVQIRERLRDQPLVQARIEETIGTVYASLGLYQPAETLLREAVEINRRLGKDDDPQTLSATGSLASVYFYLAKYDESEKLYQQVVDGRQRTQGLQDRDTLRANFDLASVYAAQGRSE